MSGADGETSLVTAQTPKPRATIRTRMTLIGALPDKKRCHPETIRRYGTLKGLLREIPRSWKAPIGGIRAPGTQIRSAGHKWTLKHNARITLRMRTAPKGCRTVVDSVSRWAKPVRLSRKVDWVGSERALSEVEGVRLTSSGEVGTFQASRQVREHDFEHTSSQGRNR